MIFVITKATHSFIILNTHYTFQNCSICLLLLYFKLSSNAFVQVNWGTSSSHSFVLATIVVMSCFDSPCVSSIRETCRKKARTALETFESDLQSK